ncbi:MAG: PQQ-dependent sugar dehydrogenase [Burkholderiales bacterium]|nr:PQQ-dependent sugar dehydrogenase [Burkholderiales bacterium]
MKAKPPPSLARSPSLRVAVLLLWLAACGGGDNGGSSSSPSPSPAPAPAPTPAPPPPAPTPAPTPAPSPGAPPRAETFASGLNTPWSLAFLPDGSMLVTERGGQLKRVSADGTAVSAPIAGMPAVDSGGQGGLFDVAVASDFATSRRIYLSFAEAGSGAEAGRNGTAVGTGVLDAGFSAMSGWTVLFRQAPKVSGTQNHYGGRLVLASDGHLFVTLGERSISSERGRAQDLAAGHGKVMRIRASDGGAPGDNPFVGTAGAQATIWSYGHRNPQGAALHPATGELWTSEHGPQGGDEVNRTLPGRNYGWPLVSYGCEYGAPVGNCPPVGGASTGPGFEPPLTWWVPTSIAPSGMAFYTGDRFPEWKGNLFVGALAGKALWRLTLNGNAVASREALFTGLNERIRDVRQGPDGWLYLLTDSTSGRIVRIVR